MPLLYLFALLVNLATVRRAWQVPFLPRSRSKNQRICGDSNFCSAQKRGESRQIRRRNFSSLRHLCCELLSQESSSKSH